MPLKVDVIFGSYVIIFCATLRNKFLLPCIEKGQWVTYQVLLYTCMDKLGDTVKQCLLLINNSLHPANEIYSEACLDTLLITGFTPDRSFSTTEIARCTYSTASVDVYFKDHLCSTERRTFMSHHDIQNIIVVYSKLTKITFIMKNITIDCNNSAWMLLEKTLLTACPSQTALFVLSIACAYKIIEIYCFWIRAYPFHNNGLCIYFISLESHLELVLNSFLQ